MARLNLTNIRTVCMIAKLGTFERAALRLHATQPTITARVHDLEESLGIQLFQRHGRRMLLTAKGRLLVERLEPLIEQMDQTMEMISSPELAYGVVRIGIGVVTMTWFRNLIVPLQEAMPNIRYEIESDMGMNMMSMIQEGKLDVAIVAGKVRNRHMLTSELMPVEFQWVMSSKIPRESNGRRLTTRELLESTPVWFVSRSSEAFSTAFSVLSKFGAKTDNINTCGNLAALLELLQHGAGIGQIATPLARSLLDSGELVPVSDDLPPEMLPFTLVWHSDQPQSFVRHLIDRIIEFNALKA